MNLKTGQALHSVVDATSVIVVKAPDTEVTITCGGREMVAGKPTMLHEALPEAQAGTQIGKRYADEQLGLELLCTKAGSGTLSANGSPLPLKDAKPLPASD